MRIRGRIRIPCEQQVDGSGGTVVVTTPPTPAPAAGSDNLALLVGQLQATVAQQAEALQQLQSQVDMLQAEERWTEDRFRNLWQELYQTQEQAQAAVVAAQAAQAAAEEAAEAAEEHQEEQEEVIEGAATIPSLPAQVQTQTEPEPAATRKRPWFL